jgi:hypothetical protein
MATAPRKTRPLRSKEEYEAKRKLLVRAVANAFQNDEAIEPATLREIALSQLKPVHVRALAHLIRVASDPNLIDDQHRHNAMQNASQDVPISVRAMLIQTDVVIPVTSIFGGGVAVFDVSDFGHDVIRELRDAGDNSL